MADTPTAEQLAQAFHEAYERLAPEHGYKTRDATAVPWRLVPGDNKRLMIAVAEELLRGILAETLENLAATRTAKEAVLAIQTKAAVDGAVIEGIRQNAEQLARATTPSPRSPGRLRGRWGL